MATAFINLSFVIIFYFLNDRLDEKTESRFPDHKAEIKELNLELEDLIKKKDAWEATAYADTTYGEVLEVLQEKYNIEYSGYEYGRTGIRLHKKSFSYDTKKVEVHRRLFEELKKNLLDYAHHV